MPKLPKSENLGFIHIWENDISMQDALKEEIEVLSSIYGAQISVDVEKDAWKQICKLFRK